MLYTCVSPPDFGQLPEHDDAVIAAAACQVFGAKETDSKILSVIRRFCRHFPSVDRRWLVTSIYDPKSSFCTSLQFYVFINAESTESSIHLLL